MYCNVKIKYLIYPVDEFRQLFGLHGFDLQVQSKGRMKFTGAETLALFYALTTSIHFHMEKFQRLTRCRIEMFELLAIITLTIISSVKKENTRMSI